MPADCDDPALWGHSRAAHRVFGWCSDCEGRRAVEEVIAWRDRENDAHEARAVVCGG